MTLHKNLNITLLLTIALALFACSRTITGLTKERIEVQKTVFKIQAPTGDKKVNTTIGGHGLWFTIMYPDSSFIYYTSD